MPNPVTHFEIQSADAEKTRAFFQDVFSWHLNVMPEMGYALVDTQTESGIGGGIGESEDGQSLRHLLHRGGQRAGVPGQGRRGRRAGDSARDRHPQAR